MSLSLTTEQIERYSRQILVPDFGGKGQIRLRHGRVLIIGAGGLGSPSAFYLAAAGVGTVGLIDADNVELSNLQRQILHATADLGKAKVESGKDTLTELNPDVEVITYPVRLDSDSTMLRCA
jgi:molybdopterin-synthase adenylyltransferase